MTGTRILQPGEPAPWFRQRSTSNPNYAFDTVGGRYVVLCFHHSAGDAAGREMLRIVEERRTLFDDDTVAFFGVSTDPADEKEQRLKPMLPGVRYFWDFDRKISQLYGVSGPQGDRRVWMVMDPTLRIRAVFQSEGGAEWRKVADYLASLPPVAEHPGLPVHAPVLVLPNVFEPEFCERLIGLYETHGGRESGFMREMDGKTTRLFDNAHKRRADYDIEDKALQAELRMRIIRKVVPEISRIHNFKVTRMERYIVACYDSVTGGHFRPHRDNTSKGTAHRRFAVSINLNDAFEGGELYFPEYGQRSIKIPKGAAVVFSCALMHAVTPVTAGRRFAFLPFLYDDAAAAIREANNRYLAQDVGQYHSNAAARPAADA